MVGRPYDRNQSGKVPSAFVAAVNPNNIICRHGGPQHPSLTDYNARLRTFIPEKGWSAKVGYPSAKDIAAAGFYCDGTDLLRCYYCAMMLEGYPIHMVGGFSPKVIHRLYFPQCFLSKVSLLSKPTVLPEPRGESKACMMCYTNEANVVSVSCTHVLGCMTCVARMLVNQCPFCRKELEAVMQIRT